MILNLRRRDAAPRAFTLIEMIVSIALFTVVMLVATSAYLVMIQEDRRARATNDLVTNMSFAVDTISRGLRTGTDYQCGGTTTNCPTVGQSSITFMDDEGQTEVFALKNGTIGQCTGSTCSSANVTPFTDPRITIQSLTFFVRGVGTDSGNDIVQPNVVFTIKGTMTPDAQTGPVTFSIQSMATQRVIEVQ